jgi:hypothetical protein
MVEFKYEELMERSVDGTLSPEEQAKLDNYLETHPNALQYYENIKRTKSVLDKVPQHAPPTEMTQNIMAAVRSRSSRAEEKRNIFELIRDKFRSGITWKYAYSFVAGALCGIVILMVSLNVSETQVPIDPTLVSGTMLTSQWPDNIPISEERNFNLGVSHITMALKLTEDFVILDMDITSSNEVTVDVVYNVDDMSFSGIWEPRRFKGDISLQDGKVTLSQQSGGSYMLLFVNAIHDTSKLIIKVVSGDASHTEEIMLTPANK